MSRVLVVDENDNVIGVKDTADRAPEDIRRSSSLWITNTEGHILMAKRAATKRYDAGKWGVAAAGVLEEGETYDSNIIKEAQEEIGVTLTIEQLVRGPKLLMHGTNDFFCQWYFCTLDKAIEDFVLEPQEVAELAWFTPEELKNRFKNHPEEFVKTAPEYLPLFLPLS